MAEMTNGKRVFIMKAFKVIMVIFLGSIWIAKLAIAGTLYDNFNDNMTGPLWVKIEKGGPVAAESDGMLEIILPAESSGDDFSAGYQSTCKLRGDYDIQVDYNLIEFPPQNGVRIGLCAEGGGVERPSMSNHDSWPTGEHYSTDFSGAVSLLPTSDRMGKLRLVRIGNMITGYYFKSDTSTWQTIGSGSANTGDTFFTLGAWSHDYAFDNHKVTIGFDNMIINNGELVCLNTNPNGLFFLDNFEGNGISSDLWDTSSDTKGNRWCDNSTSALGPGYWVSYIDEPCKGTVQSLPFGNIQVSNGLAGFSATSSRAFPYIWRGPPTKSSPFPSDGDFDFEMSLRFDSISLFGTGLNIRYWQDSTPVGSSPPSSVEQAVFGLWADSSGVSFEGTSISNPYNFHKYKMSLKGTNYYYFVDDQMIAGPISSNIRPNSIWIGNPTAAYWWAQDWTSFTIDYLKVSVGSDSLVHNSNVSGTVNDLNGKPLEDVTIAVASQTANTDASGKYTLSSIPPGTYTVTISKPGYATITKTITLTAGTTTFRTFTLTSAVASDIQVVDVSSKYNGFLYYMAGTDFSVTYNTNVSWGGHQPGFVRFITAKGSYDVPTTTTSASRTFNIATDFEPCTTLRVVAIAADGKMSAEKSADFTVMSPILGGMVFGGIDIGDGFFYKTKQGFDFTLIDEAISDDLIPANIPLFGKKGFNLRFVPTIETTVNMNGKTEIYLDWENKPIVSGKMAGIEYNLSPYLEIEGQFQHPGCSYYWNGSVGLKGYAKVSKSWPYIFMAGPVPVPMYAKATIELNEDAKLGFVNISPRTLNGQLYINPYVRGSLGAGADEVLAVEGWIGGGADYIYQFPAEPHLKDIQVYLNGGVSVYALLWKWEREALRWDWSLNGSSESAAKAANFRTNSMTLIPRNYLSTTGSFGKQSTTKTLLKAVTAAPQSYAVSTIPLQTSIFPYSTPRLSSAGTNLNLTWLTDNATRSTVNRTQAAFSSYSGTTWSTPQPVADDGTADFSPVALTFSDGTVIAAWEDEKIVLPDTAVFSDMVQNMEVSTAIYDPSTNTWKPYPRLTDNAYLDRSPKLAGKTKDNVMLVWIANEANDIRGGNDAPNKVWYATFNGTVWSSPQLAAQVPFGIVKYSFAYDGNRARLILSLDTDGDSSTVTDNELYLLSYDSNTWGALTRLTDDTAAPVADDNPQVAFDTENDFVLTWLRGNEISSIVSSDMADRDIIRVDKEYSSNLADFKLISAPDGKMALVWAEPSTNSSDIFTAVYDPIYELWGGPKQLTFDAETEKNITTAFLGSETIVAVYNRTLMGQVTPIATDLYMLTHTMGNDLALEGGSLVATPANPAPGDSVTFTVTALNLGDTVQETIPVAFYQGDPANGGIKISEATIAGPFKPGDTQDVSINWIIPLTTAPLTIYAIIDPTASLDPMNRSNNVTTMTITMADVSLPNVSWTKLTDKLVSITARVTNSGAMPSQATTIKFRQDLLGGTILNSQALPVLGSGEAMDLNFIWDVTGLTNQQYMVFAAADEDNVVPEFDETNNTGSVTIPVNLTNVMATLNVQTTGTGSGSVSSTPAGLGCNVSCSGQFPWGTAVTLKATAAPYSKFSGWASPFFGTEDCTVSMSGANGITAMFDYDAAHKARIYATTPAYYSTLSEALLHATSGAIIQAWAQPFTENVTVNKTLKLKGGYDESYVSNGGFSILDGRLNIRSGSFRAEKLKLR